MSSGTSIGSILGAVVGAVIGFFVGSVPGALKGAVLGLTIGGGIGSVIDPLEADYPSIDSTQDPMKLDVPSSQEGKLVTDLLGTAKITGFYLWYGNNRSVEVEDENSGSSVTIEGGKGGTTGGTTSDSGTTYHYEYYLTWIMGVAVGPVDELLAIYRDEECVWSGTPGVTRAEYGDYAQIDVPNIGTVYFYFGTDTQQPPPIDEWLDEGQINIPYRHLCYALFYDCWLGDYNRVPSYSFVVRKNPEISLNNPYGIVNTYEINPAHMIWYILTSPDFCGMNKDYIDEDSFSDMADTLYNENFGLGLLLDQHTNAITYVETILRHIEGALKWTTQGKLKAMLFRGGEDVGSLPRITLDYMLEPPQLTRGSTVDALTEIKVQFDERYDCDDCCWDDDYTNPSVSGDEEITTPGGWQYTASDGCEPYVWRIKELNTTKDVNLNTQTGYVEILEATCGWFTLEVEDVCGNTADFTVRILNDSAWVEKGAASIGTTTHSLHNGFYAWTAYGAEWCIVKSQIRSDLTDAHQWREFGWYKWYLHFFEWLIGIDRWVSQPDICLSSYFYWYQPAFLKLNRGTRIATTNWINSKMSGEALCENYDCYFATGEEDDDLFFYADRGYFDDAVYYGLADQTRYEWECV